MYRTYKLHSKHLRLKLFYQNEIFEEIHLETSF